MQGAHRRSTAPFWPASCSGSQPARWARSCSPCSAASESAAGWERFLTDLYRRGLTGDGLEMICVDGSSRLPARGEAEPVNDFETVTIAIY